MDNLPDSARVDGIERTFLDEISRFIADSSFVSAELLLEPVAFSFKRFLRRGPHPENNGHIREFEVSVSQPHTDVTICSSDQNVFSAHCLKKCSGRATVSGRVRTR